MEATTRIKKAVSYLDGLEFALSDRLSKVRNAQTLLKGALTEISKLQTQNKALRELLNK